MWLTVLVRVVFAAIGTTARAAGSAISMAKGKWPFGQRIEFSLVALKRWRGAYHDQHAYGFQQGRCGCNGRGPCTIRGRT